MNNKIAIVTITVLALSGCMHNKINVRTLDSVIIESAQIAKKAGAEKLSVELSVGFAKKATAEIPISIVTFGGEVSLSNSTKVTAEIDLTKWVDPTASGFVDNAPTHYILDTDTMTLTLPSE